MVYLNLQLQELMLFPLFFVIANHVWGGDYYPEYYTPYGTGKSDFFWNDALNVMSYHRSKMNEYLCKNYLANEIVDTLRNRSENVEKRVGEVTNRSRLERDSLLSDPGSQKYKDWLSRSSTLEDIYRQFEHPEGTHDTPAKVEHEHEGDVTGYAVVGHKPIYSKPIEYGEADHHFFGPHVESHHPHEYHEYYEEDEYDEKGLKLKELFHFALTAIAFLAFATFMIEVIMYLMDIPQQPTDPDYVLIPTATGTGTASKVEDTDPGVTSEERTLGMSSLPVEIVNTMSSRVLTSIDAMTILYKDDGHCLRRALCENSKYSKSIPGIQKIWLPIWSLGASWVAGRLSKGKDSARGTDTLEYLKATVLGLGSSECHALYPSCKRTANSSSYHFHDPILSVRDPELLHPFGVAQVLTSRTPNDFCLQGNLLFGGIANHTRDRL